MAAYNAENYIIESIISVQRQTFKDWELIVVDDGSKDNTAALVKNKQKTDTRIIYHYQENKRLGGARNTGLRLAKGNYIAFLDSDDLWFSEKLEKQLEAFRQFNADVIFTDGYIMKEETGILIPYPPTAKGFFTGKQIYKRLYNVSNCIPVVSVILKKEWVDKVGEQEEVLTCEDIDYWLRLAKAGAVFYGMKDKLFQYRMHGNNQSSNTMKMIRDQTMVFYNNLDFTFIDKNAAYVVFRTFTNILVPQLLIVNKNEEALLFIRRIQGIKWKLNYFFVYLLVKWNTFSIKFIRILLFVPSFLPGVKRQIKEIVKPFFIFFEKILFRIYKSYEYYKLTAKPRFFNFQYKSANIHPSVILGASTSIEIINPHGKLFIDQGVCFRKFCNINIAEYGNLEIQEGVFFNNYCSITCIHRITIGANSIFGEGVKIYDHNHKYHLEEKIIVEREGFGSGEVNIGKNCWIASNVTILSNVEIGDNVIIGAGNLIYKSVPSNTIVKAKYDKEYTQI